MPNFATGESGLARPLTPDEFTEPCDPVLTCAVFCDYFNINMPVLRQTYSVKDTRFHGWYRPKEQVLAYSHNYLGLILHELAHHVVSRQGHDVRGRYHHAEFWAVLQKMIDMSV